SAAQVMNDPFVGEDLGAGKHMKSDYVDGRGIEKITARWQFIKGQAEARIGTRRTGGIGTKVRTQTQDGATMAVLRCQEVQIAQRVQRDEDLGQGSELGKHCRGSVRPG